MATAAPHTPLRKYLNRLSQEYKTGVTTEQSLRPALVDFLKATDELRKFTIINEPKRIACGAPDIVLLQKNSIPVAYLETKDIGDPDLLGIKQNKAQFSRYKQGLDCIVFTDFLRFLLYRGEECLLEIQVARQNGNTLYTPRCRATFYRTPVYTPRCATRPHLFCQETRPPHGRQSPATRRFDT